MENDKKWRSKMLDLFQEKTEIVFKGTPYQYYKQLLEKYEERKKGWQKESEGKDESKNHSR